jgi:hypothetical protein
MWDQIKWEHYAAGYWEKRGLLKHPQGWDLVIYKAREKEIYRLHLIPPGESTIYETEDVDTLWDAVAQLMRLWAIDVTYERYDTQFTRAWKLKNGYFYNPADHIRYREG